MKLSIVTTLYQSAPYVAEFYARTSSVAQQLVGEDYEIVFVNDGSPDNSLEVAVKLTQDSHVIVVDLSRNFGHHKAMMTGLAHAQGDLIFLIDSDLEEEPEWLLSFADQMAKESCDVVYGVQEKRRGNWFERWSGEIFYCLFRYLTGINYPSNIVTARVMTRRYVDALLHHKEREVLIGGLWHITGFNQLPQDVKKHSTSQTTYTFLKKFSVFFNAIISFSYMPLIVIFNIGITIFFGSLLYVFYIILLWAFLNKVVDGWTSIMASIWLLGGIMISFIGIIGIYLAKIFSETKQ